jgi:N-acetylmuramic acid 6-phosphate etherase
MMVFRCLKAVMKVNVDKRYLIGIIEGAWGNQMTLPRTETRHQAATGLDALADRDIVATLVRGQVTALGALEQAQDHIAQGAALMARSVVAGGHLVYVAAGSSGLMALADAAELGGTFGLDPAQIRILMAGGLPVDARMPGDTEDDAQAAQEAANTIAPTDTVIALSASGNTAYPTTIARIARQRDAQVICIANNPNAALFTHADVAICLPTPPELIAGSTRMGAATAQKAALNAMSTLMGIRLGHVHDGMMVSVVADNDKLRARAAAMVAQIAGVDGARAATCLQQAGGAVKPAVLLALGAVSLGAARQILDDTNGHLRAALARV